MEREGASLMVMLMASEAGRPPESETEAVMVWSPSLNVLTLIAPPVPRLPS